MPAGDGEWSGNHDGRDIGSGVSVIIEDGGPGSGPKLHQHRYAETFVIRSGRALFTIGDQKVEGSGGQVLVAPANTPHRFEVLGPDRYEAVHIHESPEIVTEWLE